MPSLGIELRDENDKELFYISIDELYFAVINSNKNSTYEGRIDWLQVCKFIFNFLTFFSISFSFSQFLKKFIFSY